MREHMFNGTLCPLPRDFGQADRAQLLFIDFFVLHKLWFGGVVLFCYLVFMFLVIAHLFMPESLLLELFYDCRFFHDKACTEINE